MKGTLDWTDELCIGASNGCSKTPDLNHLHGSSLLKNRDHVHVGLRPRLELHKRLPVKGCVR